MALAYDPETGILRWRPRRDRSKSWNAHFAGKVAGCIQTAACGKQYRSVRLNGVSCRAHHLIWLHVYGEWPKEIVDHRDGSGLNNRIKNLREATHAQNTFNRSAQRDSKTGIKGVSRHGNRWRARIDGNGVTEEKTFKLIGEAALWYREMADRLHGDFASEHRLTDQEIEALSRKFVIVPSPRTRRPITSETFARRNARPQSNNRCGHRGIYQHRPGAWCVRIKAFGIQHHVGCYNSIDAAIAARAEAESRFHGDFAHKPTGSGS